MLPPLRNISNSGASYSKMSAKPVSNYGTTRGKVSTISNDNVKNFVRSHIVSNYGQDAYIDNMPSYMNWLYSEAQKGKWPSFKNYAAGMQTAWNDNNQRKYSEGMLQILKTEFAEFLTVELPQEQAQQKQAQAEIDAEKNKKILTYIGVGGGALALLTAGFLAFVKIKKKGRKKVTKKSPVPEDFRYISIEEQPNKLAISLTPSGKEEVEDEGISVMSFYELFEDVQGNSEYLYFDDAGQGGLGLTSAPAITEGYYYDDDGDITSNKSNKLWWFPNYMVEDFTETLSREGKVEFTLVDE